MQGQEYQFKGILSNTGSSRLNWKTRNYVLPALTVPAKAERLHLLSFTNLAKLKSQLTSVK